MVGRSTKRSSASKRVGAMKKESTGEGEYKVEKIVSKVTQGGTTLYLIQWEGFGEDERTWEPASNLHKDLVAEYERQIADGKVKSEPIDGPPLPPPVGVATRKRQPKPSVPPLDSDEEEEGEEPADPDDDDPDFDDSQSGGRRRSRAAAAGTSRGRKQRNNDISPPPNKIRRKSAGRKRPTGESSEEEDDDSDDENNGDEKENSPARTSRTKHAAVARRLTAESPMVFAEGAYLLREADFKMKKTERPYLKDGIPIWRVDNRHLIQLYQRAKPDDYKRYLRTDLYDSWLCNDATGFHLLKVLNLQKTYGRDAEVSVELDDLWIDRLKQYDLSGPIEFESSWAAPTVNGGASQESSGGQSVDRQESDDEEEDGDEVPSSFIGAADGVMSVATRPDAAASDQVELANGTEGHS